MKEADPCLEGLWRMKMNAANIPMAVIRASARRYLLSAAAGATARLDAL